MSLYHEAASILTKSQAEGVSIRTTVFAKKDWKSPAKVLLALACEAAKWSSVLSMVVENSGILRIEKQLTPVLALLLVHDFLLAKRGIALPQTHGLNACIQRHKARLNAEFTKARIRLGCSSLDQLRLKIEQEATGADDAEVVPKHPRWIRINTIRSSKEEQFSTTFATFTEVETIAEILVAKSGQKLVFIDTHIPDLLAVPSEIDLTSSRAYRDGKIIFQDKASCFPAYLIDPQAHDGDVIDACAAPGNKTTHLAAILDKNIRASQEDSSQRIYACEKDTARSRTLVKMTSLAGGDQLINIMTSQNFHKLDPKDGRFANVTKLLLDPSCSGSGIVSRDQGAVTVHLPATEQTAAPKSNKRKRVEQVEQAPASIEEEAPTQKTDDSRLNDLAAFQLRILLHAMLFPAARQISYSTCSVHAKENEEVVIRALQSQVAVNGGWRIQRREEQVKGIRDWHVRGDVEAVEAFLSKEAGHINVTTQDLAEACVRCNKHGDDGTMGFFVAGFIRGVPSNARQQHLNDDNEDDTEDWDGFEDG